MIISSLHANCKQGFRDPGDPTNIDCVGQPLEDTSKVGVRYPFIVSPGDPIEEGIGILPSIRTQAKARIV